MRRTKFEITFSKSWVLFPHTHVRRASARALAVGKWKRRESWKCTAEEPGDILSWRVWPTFTHLSVLFSGKSITNDTTCYAVWHFLLNSRLACTNEGWNNVLPNCLGLVWLVGLYICVYPAWSATYSPFILKSMLTLRVYSDSINHLLFVLHVHQ